ncbi:MAG: carbamoyl-phosphate synthase domain-containing protein [Chitinophagaceae bacterium]
MLKVVGVKVKGVIGKNLEEQYSRFQATNSLQKYFEDQNIVAIDGIDTRSLVAHVRTQGAMNCIISSENFNEDELKKTLSEVPSMAGLELASTVSTKNNYELGNPESDIRVAVLDYGVKQNILKLSFGKRRLFKSIQCQNNF